MHGGPDQKLPIVYIISVYTRPHMQVFYKNYRPCMMCSALRVCVFIAWTYIPSPRITNLSSTSVLEFIEEAKSSIT